MYINEKILVGKGENKEAYILPKMANRHGIISGASGSGKTITLKVLAESFSDARVPVFLVDVKGDLAGCAFKGVSNSNIEERIEKLGLEGFEFRKYPVTFWDVYGQYGHPIRTTVSKTGARLLSKMLDLSDAQEGILSIAFKIAEDENLELVDLKDLRSLLNYIGDKRKEYSLSYGNITTQSVGSIQRNILTLQEEGGDFFFGSPDFNIKDFIHYDADTGNGQINILHASTLFQKPNLYSTFLLWLLTYLYNSMPEVGDLDKPKIVFFFDEAHLLFNGMPTYRLKQIVQVVKLIRSRGIGLFFISQSPADIPNEIIAQLGNRVQHTLRAYTPAEQKVVKAAADSFRANPKFDTAEAILTLGTGEALVSFQNENGEPEIVEKAIILPPQSMMGTIDDITRNKVINSSTLVGKYDETIERDSAFEELDKMIRASVEAEEAEKKAIEEAKEAEKAAKLAENERIAKEKEEAKLKREAEKAQKAAEKAKKNTVQYKLGKKVANKTVDKVLNKALNKMMKGLFK